MTVDFNELGGMNVNLCGLVSMKFADIFDGQRAFTSPAMRPTHTVFCFGNVSRTYRLTETGEVVDTGPDDIVLVTRGVGCECVTRTYDKSKPSFGLFVDFVPFDESGAEIPLTPSLRVFTTDRGGRFHELFERAASLYSQNSFINGYTLKSAVYELFGALFDELTIERSSSLRPALDRLVNFSEDISVGELAALCHVSESTFRSRFKRFSGGLSPTEYRNKNRAVKAVELLRNNNRTVESVAVSLGYYDSAHLCRHLKKYLGSAPSNFRAGGNGGTRLF